MTEETKPTEQQIELKAQEACMTELLKVAEAHGYIIKAAVAQVPDTGSVMVIGGLLSRGMVAAALAARSDAGAPD